MPLSYDIINQGIILDLQFLEGSGVITRDWADAHHNDPTLTGAPTWSQLANDLNYLDFNSGNPDYIQIAAADSADLDFQTADDFSISMWINPDSVLGARYLFSRHKTGAGGGGFAAYHQSGLFAFVTYQNTGSSNTSVSSTEMSISNWYLIVITRSGSSARLYINGIDVTVTTGNHTTIATATEKMLFGINRDEASNPFDGKMWRPRIWNRALSKEEIKFIFEKERKLFGV